MIVIMRPRTPQQEIDKLTDALTSRGVEVNPVIGKDLIILGLVGDTSKIDPTWIEANRNVERVMHVAEPVQKGQPHVPSRPDRREGGGARDRRQKDHDDGGALLGRERGADLRHRGAG